MAKLTKWQSVNGWKWDQYVEVCHFAMIKKWQSDTKKMQMDKKDKMDNMDREIFNDGKSRYAEWVNDVR